MHNYYRKKILAISYFLLYFLIFFSIINSICWAEQFNAKVFKVFDGDTIEVIKQNSLHNEVVIIRLYGIDAPEIKQQNGKDSKDFLILTLNEKNILVDTKGTDNYGRTIGIVYLEGVNINLHILEWGQAWYYTQYCNEKEICTKFKKAEQNAQENKIGLWANRTSMAPWIFRNNGRKGN